MEALIKIKPHTMRVISSALTEGEQVQIAIPCGNLNFDPGTVPRAKDRDYLILTDRRIISIKGSWFENRQGLLSYPRTMVTGVEVANYLLGCTVTVTVEPMSGGVPTKLVFANCGKPEGEAVKKMFTEQDEGRRCTGCGRPLRDEFSFCPFCKTSAKRVCQCGKGLEDGWINCPYCGK